MRPIHLCVWCSVLVLLMASAGRAQVYDYESPVRIGVNYTSASFRCWVPETSQPLAGVLIYIPEQNADGRLITDHKIYRQKCSTWNFALLGCYFTGDKAHDYSETRRGSGLALRDALQEFSRLSNKRELFNAPMALVGFSTGAQFSVSMASFKPTDTITFISNKGAYFLTRPDTNLYKVPALFLVGGKDASASAKNSQACFVNGRERTANWAITTAAGQAHEKGGAATTQLILNYIEATNRIRTDPVRPTRRPIIIPVGQGVYLNRQTGQIIPGDSRSAQINPEWNWLPDKSIAQALRDSPVYSPKP